MFRRAVALTVSCTALACAPAAWAAAGDERGDVITADGGSAYVVTNGDNDRMELYAGPAGQAAERLQRCPVKTFEEFEVSTPAVSGPTVAWQACPDDSHSYPNATKAITVYDLAGTRTIPIETDFPRYALAGRTLAIAGDGSVRLIDLDGGGERTVAVPGEGDVVRLAGQRDGTVAIARSPGDGEDSDACGKIVVSVARPGATSAAPVPGVDCSREIAIGSDRLAFLEDTEDGYPDLFVSALDGSGAQRVDGNMDTFASDGTALSWTHHGCTGNRKAAVPLTAPGADRAERCSVRVRSARLTRTGSLAVTVRCAQGCRGATIGLGFGHERRISLRRPGTRTLVLPLTRAQRRTVRPGARVALTLNSAATKPAFPYRQVKVRVR